MILKKHTFQHKYTYNAYYYKTLFPITLAYVITSHKSQGVTINSKIIIDMKEAFAPGLTYVMLLRVTNGKNLKKEILLQMISYLALFKMIHFNHNTLQTPKFHFNTYIPKLKNFASHLCINNSTKQTFLKYNISQWK